MPQNLPIFQKPHCIIDTGKDGKLEVQESVLEQLQKLDKPLVVVAIAGLYRTGKSYLMNRLAGKTSGFALGSTIQSETKGIWLWARTHPQKEGKYLVLLDTEGLGDAEKGDRNHDNWIFCLATLLSSTLVYNALGAINEDTLGKLHFVTEMSKRIKTKSGNGSGSDSTDFDRFFPTFIFALRDFTLLLQIDGEDVTSDEYLEHCLKLEKKGRTSDFNKQRRCIREYFKTRKCFTFDTPASRKKLAILDTLTNEDLSEDFVEEVETFLKYVHAECPVKKLEDGKEINGRMLSTMVTTYVDAIRNGKLPCIESAVASLAKIENARALLEGSRLYNEEMGKLSLPTSDDDELRQCHSSSLKMALTRFLDIAVADENNKFQEELNEEIEKKLKEYIKKNENKSRNKCKEALAHLHEPIADRIKSGTYVKPGGYAEYQQDIIDIEKEFQRISGLGIKKEECLLEFLKNSMTEGGAILAVDRQVTKLEQEAEEKRREAMEIELKAKEAEREYELRQQLREEEEAARKLNQEMAEMRHQLELAALKQHMEEVNEHRIKEHTRKLQEGFEEKMIALEVVPEKEVVPKIEALPDKELVSEINVFPEKEVDSEKKKTKCVIQ